MKLTRNNNNNNTRSKYLYPSADGMEQNGM